MTETNEQRLDRLHDELSGLYRSGLLHTRPAEDIRLSYYWVRIWKLEEALHRETLADQASAHRAAKARVDAGRA